MTKDDANAVLAAFRKHIPHIVEAAAGDMQNRAEAEYNSMGDRLADLLDRRNRERSRMFADELIKSLRKDKK